MSAKAKPIANPRFARGDRVIVRQPGLRPWEGDVIAVKWSHVSGWRYDVRNDEHYVWVLPEDALAAVVAA